MNTFFETVNPITIISFAIISTCVFMWLLRIRINSLEKTQINYEKKITFFSVSQSFYQERDFKKQLELLITVQGYMKQLYTEQFSVMTITMPQLLYSYNVALAESLTSAIQRKSVKKVLQFITDELINNDHLDFEDKQFIIDIVTKNTDLGFQYTLQKAYGYSKDSDIIDYLIAEQSSIELFKSKYLNKNYTLHNNFHYLLEEIKTCDNTSIRDIVKNWILRGGLPDQQTYLALQRSVESGY